jgi:hypothetical protein
LPKRRLEQFQLVTGNVPKYKTSRSLTEHIVGAVISWMKNQGINFFYLQICFFICCTRHRGGPKKYSRLWKKKTDFWHLVLSGKMSCLRSRHLVLWSLGTLTGQQRFYGSGLIT